MMRINFYIIIIFIAILFPQGKIDPVFTGSFGSVTINNQVYNQFSLKPELVFGKVGLGLDLYFYFDQDGNMYDENWNFSTSKDTYKTLVDKIYYLRWGLPYEDTYFRVGALPGITLGSGSLVNRYSNVMDYPRVRRTGFNFKYKFQNFRLQFVHSDLKELNEPGLVAVEGTFEYIKNLDFTFSLVSDPNQKKGLLDSDGDGYPDHVERDFANDSSQWHEFQDDIYNLYNNPYCVSNDDLDVDENGLNDACDSAIEQYENMMVNDLSVYELENKDEVSGLSLGLTYTVNSNIKLYSEFSQLLGKTLNPYINPYDIESHTDLYNDHQELYGERFTNFDDNLGYGFIPFGLKAEWENVILTIDYRENSEHYLFNFWDQNYDHNRVMVDSGNKVVTKEDKLYKYGKSKGGNITISSNFLKYFHLNVGYQHLDGEKWDSLAEKFKSDKNNSFYTKLDIDTSKINKVRVAEIFYKQSNSSKPFSIKDKDENTLFGYNVGIEMADNMILILKGRKSYEINETGEYTPVKTTQIETQVIF